MRYILLNDISNILKKRFLLILFIILVSLSYVLICYINKNVYFDNRFLEHVINFTLSIKIDILNSIKTSDIIGIGMILLNYGLFLLIGIDIFKNDLFNYDNLLERVNINRWIFSKIMVTILFSLIVFTIIYLLSNIIFPLNISYLIIIKKILVVSIITCYTYLLLILIKKNIPLFIISLLPIISILFITIDLRLINIIYLILVFIIMFILLNILCYYTKFSDIKE